MWEALASIPPGVTKLFSHRDVPKNLIIFKPDDVWKKTPFMNPHPPTQWSGPENMAQVRMDDESSWTLLDSGLTINAVTPEFIEAHSLDVGPLSDLADGTLGINGFGGKFSQLMGYVIIRVQVEGVWG